MLGWTVIRVVSPEFMLRPSLSGDGAGRRRHKAGRVAGVYAPAFVERPPRWRRTGARSAGVAGVYAPAFVERAPGKRRTQIARRVAGVYAPAFVERDTAAVTPAARRTRVSPEFMLRPSLSAETAAAAVVRHRSVAGVYAPAFVERSTRAETSGYVAPRSVAGVYAPAFVERWLRSSSGRSSSRVAGVYAPAFVERSRFRFPT